LKGDGSGEAADGVIAESAQSFIPSLAMQGQSSIAPA